MSDVVRLYGDKDLIKKLTPEKIAGAPARRFLNQWRLFTEREGKKNAPVWRGQLRRSITSEVDSGPFPKGARVGTNTPYARPMEFGTGLLSEDPSSSHRRHFPPPQALDAWAIAHGFHVGSRASATADARESPGTYGLIVSRMIYQRGGIKPRRYLRDAKKSSEAHIPQWLGEMAANIERQAGNGAG